MSDGEVASIYYFRKVDIYIKSFNRPYYLERCLQSIKRLVQGEYNIVILDDGTPAVYLQKIQQMFPDVKIRKSIQYPGKSEMLQKHASGIQPYTQSSIPSKLWYDAIKEGSPVFLLLEEDVWLTAVVNLTEIADTMNQQNLIIVKIGWNGCDGVVFGKKLTLTDDVEEIIPSLPTSSDYFLTPFFRNTFKFKSILTKLGLIKTTFTLPYYTLYTVTSAFFDKSYWLSLWEGAGEYVNEGYQLHRAVKWKKTHDSRYAKTCNEKLKTSFITASINRFKHVQFDMISLHRYLNEAWLKGDLDCMNNYPNDFSVGYLKRFIPENDPNCTPEQWDHWIALFKNMYRSVGCAVD